MINATWNAISPEMRTTLLPAQRVWIKRKAADCAVEAAEASTDAEQKEAARLSWDARHNRERTDFSEQYVAEPDVETTTTDAAYP